MTVAESLKHVTTEIAALREATRDTRITTGEMRAIVSDNADEMAQDVTSLQQALPSEKPMTRRERRALERLQDRQH